MPEGLVDAWLAGTPRRVACVLPREPIGAAFAEACLRLTPQVSLRAGGAAIFLDITRSRHLFNEQALPLKLEALARRFGLSPPRLAIAATPGEALARARSGPQGALPLESLRDFADPFGRDRDGGLARQVASLIGLLARLGVRDADECLRIPEHALASRFGREGVDVMRAVRGVQGIAWPVFKLPERVSELVSVQDAETLSSCGGDLEALLFFVKRVADRAMARLRARCLRASEIELTFELERGPPRAWSIGLPIAQGSTAGLLPILRDRLSFDLMMSPLDAPVTSARFDVLETMPGHGAQRDFFSQKEEQAEARDALVARLAAKLGKDRAFVAVPTDRHPPERSWDRQLTLAAARALPWHAAIARPLPRRPLRLLKEPEPLRRVSTSSGDWLIGATGRRYEAVDWNGPERLCAEWWSATPVSRDYFEVVARGGERLWVFTEHAGGGLCLHGYFD